MAATVWKFISLYFGQVAWLEGKNITESWKVSGKCFRCSKCGGLDYFFFPLPLGFLDISDGICSCCFGSKVEKKSSWWKGVVYFDPPSMKTVVKLKP